MSCIVVGLDGSAAGEKALAHARMLSKLIGECELVLVFVIEWSPYTFHTPQELEDRHKRREAEIETARSHVLVPAARAAEADGFAVSTEVHHGDASVLLDQIANDRGALQIVVGRTGEHGLRERLFGGVSGKLVASASVPVTIIP